MATPGGLVRDALAEVIPLAAELHVTLAIEPMHPECALDWTFLTCLQETLDLVKSGHSPQMKLVFDLPPGLGHSIIARLGDPTNDRDRPPGRWQAASRPGSKSLPPRLGLDSAERDCDRTRGRRLPRLLRRRADRRRDRSDQLSGSAEVIEASLWRTAAGVTRAVSKSSERASSATTAVRRYMRRDAGRSSRLKSVLKLPAIRAIGQTGHGDGERATLECMCRRDRQHDQAKIGDQSFDEIEKWRS